VRKQSKPETLTVEETAKRLRLGRNQAYQAVARGQLPAIRVGRRWLIPVAALERMLGGAVTSPRDDAA
jgi:excisionase family DNA binding protein